ncbi:MAG: diguanylate cyclase [Candidatus Latescibacteria bacterium]|nr:diguanylate cyclase [Candidatus Latescibacterota bacterium]
MKDPVHILVVDDEPDIREILMVFLERMGYAVEAASSGTQALERIEQQAYDVVITDLDLGDMSGMEVLAQVKQQQAASEVIMISGYGNVEHVSEAFGLGASAYIQKPITFAEVDVRMKEALANRRFAASVDQIVRQASGTDVDLGGHLEQVFHLYDLGRRLIATLDYQRVIDTVLSSLASLFRCECAYIFLVENGGAVLHVYSDLPMSEADLGAVRADALVFWQNLRKEEIAEGRVKISHRSRLNGDAPRPSGGDTRKMRAPLSVQEKVIGLLSVRNPTVRTASNLEYLPYIVGNLAALALDNASQHRHTRMLALTDGLTGLHNHRAFLDRLHQEFDRSRRYNSILAMIMLDIDDFKRVNDTYGHLQGDLVLKGVARILRNTSRESDVLCRYGGEEFVALLPETNASQALLKAERIRKEIASHPFQLNHCAVDVTVSLGVATWPNLGIQVPEDLIKHADQALYRSKSLGKNRASLEEQM